MGHAAVEAPAVVRVTVASGTRRVDLVLPGAVPVAELVPELARSAGLLDGDSVHGGYRLVTAGGVTLRPDAGLVPQGVEDGGLLTIAAGVDDDPPAIYDDPVEAMADAVELLPAWSPVAGRRTALGVAGLLLGLGLAGLFGRRGSVPAGVVAAVTSAALLAAAIVVSRARREAVTAVLLAWLGTAYAAGAGLVLGQSATTTAAIATGAALACLIGLDAGRALLLPPVVVGSVFLVGGLLPDPAAVPIAAMVLVVVVGGALPRAALGLAGAPSSPDGGIDPGRVAADARLADEILLGLSASVGLLLALVAPFAVSRGVPGAALAVGCSVAVLLSTRRYRAGSQVLVGLASGVTGLLSAASAALWLHPDWRSTVGMLLVAGGLVLLATTLLSIGSVRRRRIADLAETGALLALPPLAVVTVGLVAAVRG